MKGALSRLEESKVISERGRFNGFFVKTPVNLGLSQSKAQKTFN